MVASQGIASKSQSTARPRSLAYCLADGIANRRIAGEELGDPMPRIHGLLTNVAHCQVVKPSRLGQEAPLIGL